MAILAIKVSNVTILYIVIDPDNPHIICWIHKQDHQQHMKVSELHFSVDEPCQEHNHHRCHSIDEARGLSVSLPITKKVPVNKEHGWSTDQKEKEMNFISKEQFSN